MSTMTNFDNAIQPIFQVFLVLKLMKAGHRKSEPYYTEVCGRIYGGSAVNDCHVMLVDAHNKYEEYPDDFRIINNKQGSPTNQQKTLPFMDSLDTLLFEMKHMSKNTEIGQGLVNIICEDFNINISNCKNKFFAIYSKLKRMFTPRLMLKRHRVAKKETSGAYR